MLAPESGYLDDMPAAEYHRAEAMSAHGAAKILKSPAHFRVMRDELIDPKTTVAKDLGTAIHDGVLEPEAFDARVVAAPAEPKRPTSAQLKAKKPAPETIAAIEFWRDFEFMHGDKIILSPDDMARARRCIDAVRSHPAARRLLEGAIVERSLFWRDKLFGVPCKARIDISNLGGVCDLKSCRDASPEGFSRAIGDYNYHVQGWTNYSGSEHVLNASPAFFAFICVETEEPFAVATYYLGRDSLMAGARLWDEALSRYRDALAAGAWRGYPDDIREINAPRWKLRFDV
jgi:PDDEXK-like domain of unknown function (DUF3799)